MFSSNIESHHNEDGYVTHFKISFILPLFICLFQRENEYHPTISIKVEGKECELLFIEAETFSASFLTKLKNPIKIKSMMELEVGLSILMQENFDSKEEIVSYTDMWCYVGNKFIPTGPIVITKDLQELVKHDMFFQRYNDTYVKGV